VNAALYLLIGAGATGVFAIAKDLLVEGRRDRFDRERLWRRELQDARVACLLIADELDTLSGNFQLVGRKQRSPVRPIGESPFLSTREWHSGKAALARAIDQLATWQALAVVYHDADSMRNRFLADGPSAPVNVDQATKAELRAKDASDLAAGLYEASETIVSRLASGLPAPRKRWWSRKAAAPRLTLRP
jgi:hypothetical protein